MVVNNAGVMDKFDPVGTLEKDVWDRVIRINLTAPYMVSKLAVQHMLEKEIKGAIVNVSSLGGIKGFVAGKPYLLSRPDCPPSQLLGKRMCWLLYLCIRY